MFRFNRRTSRSRGLVFYRVLELAVAHQPVRYHDHIREALIDAACSGLSLGGEEQMMSDQCASTLAWPVEELVEGFRDWLVSERCLAAGTVEYYVRGARLFLGERGGRDLAVLGLGEVSSFMVCECRRLSVGSAKKLASGLRSLLRYLYVEGVIDRELAQAVPAPASWRGVVCREGWGLRR